MSPSSKGFSKINRIKETIIYFYSLSVNYNNRSPAIGNESQNGINCRRRAIIIYELLTNTIVLTNNSVAQVYFLMARIMLFSYGDSWQMINNRTNAADSLAISMAMRIRRYCAESIAKNDRYYRYRASTLYATERHDRASICPVSPRRTSWSSISA